MNYDDDSFMSYGQYPYSQPMGYGGGYGQPMMMQQPPERLYQGFKPNAGFRMVQPNYQEQNPLSSLLKFGAGAAYNLKPQDLRQQQTLAGQISNLSNAMVDPTDPTYQQIYGQEKQTAQQDLAAAIAQMSQQNRKLTQLGRVPLFNPERGGEQQFRQLTQGYQTAQDTARNRAREIIGAGIQAKQNAFTNQSQLSAMKNQNKQRQAFGISNIADMLRFL